MKVSVTSKGRKQKVPVRIEKKEEIPEDVDYCDVEEDVYSLKNLAEQLALLSPKQLRKVVSAARHLRKFADLLGTKTEKFDEDWDEDQLEINE